MDGIGRAVGAPAHIMWDGRLTPIRVTMAVIGEMEQFILATRPDPMEMVRDAAILAYVNEDVYAAAHNTAVELAINSNHVKPDEFQEFLRSREGVSLVVWINLRDDKRWTFERVSKAVAGLSDVELKDTIERITLAGGFDRHGSLDWILGEGDSEGAKDRTNWRLLLRDAFENLGVMPDEFGRLTIYQVQTLVRDKNEIEGVVRLKREEAFAMTKEERVEYVRNRKLAGRHYRKKGKKKGT